MKQIKAANEGVVKGAQESAANKEEVKEMKGKEEVAVAITKEPVNKKVQALLKDMPDKVTPKHIDEAFGFNDGGKTVRRHLRKHFSEGHEHKATWEWAKNDKTLATVLAYFADKYEIPEKKEKAAK